MFNRFARDARKLAAGARKTALDQGSPTVEAEHVLLAFTERLGTQLAALLASAGLDREGVDQAMEAETERSLAAVGISAQDFDLPAPRPTKAEPRWAASAKGALERSLKIAVARGDHRIESAHVLLGVLDANRGTVPRALDMAGVDREELSRQVEAEVLGDRG